MADLPDNKQKTPFYQTATAVFLLALILRLAFAAAGLMEPGDGRFSRPDSESYLANAASLFHTGEYRDSDGDLTAHRTPGLPLLLACLKPAADNGTTLFSVVLLVIGSLCIYPVYGACRTLAPPGASALATALFALHPTAIGAAPVLLSDTLFLFFTALTLYFFARFSFEEKHDPFFWGCTVLFAGVGTLVRPVNILWLIPAVIALLPVKDVSFRRKLIYAGAAVVLFCAITVPWMVRNHSIGAGWRLDSSSVSTMIHNASTLESNLTDLPADEIRNRYRAEQEREFEAFPWKYPTKAEQYAYTEQKMASVIAAHPVRYVAMTCRPYVFLPDVPTLLENNGITQPGRGTFDVLNREGIIAAVKHYFDDDNVWILCLMLPLILAALALYVLTAAGWIKALLKRRWLPVFLPIGFGLYYTVMTGPVQMPRYILPALPVFVLCAAMALTKENRKTPPEKV